MSQGMFPSFVVPSAKTSLYLLYLLVIWGHVSYSGHHASALPLWEKGRLCGVRRWGAGVQGPCAGQAFLDWGREQLSGWGLPEQYTSHQQESSALSCFLLR